MMIHPILLCGGSGTRLWPLSRKSYPKQFAPLLGAKSLFQSAAERLSGAGFAPPIVSTGPDFRFVVTKQLAALGLSPSAILLEPCARNTAAAVCASALALDARHPDALMLIAPADHLIPDPARFRAAVLAAATEAQAGQIVTFGIVPDRPETGYGWLHLTHPADLRPQPLRGFVEKPDANTAKTLLDGGMHLWNAGLFLARTTTLIEAFARHAPAILSACKQALAGAETDLGFTRLAEAPWLNIPNISIDYAVMERADNLSVLPYHGAWSDLGGWEQVWRESPQDSAALATNGPVTALDCRASLLRSESEGLHLVGIGLEDMIVIAMPDAVLVAPKSRAQEVKDAVEALKSAAAPQAETLPRDFRPWGWYEALAEGPRFQVKRITVQPQGILSLQSHHHRAEHWIVVEGTARVTVDDQTQLITENQSIYIPLGARHRLENPGKLPLTLIEVQTGAYLGEDDIIRFEDAYARGQGAKG